MEEYGHTNTEYMTTWRGEHDRCAWCGERERLELHHILGGNWRRPNFPWNWLMLCKRHHERLQGTVYVGVSLTLKFRSDPENYDLEAMESWMRRFGRNKKLVMEPVPSE